MQNDSTEQPIRLTEDQFRNICEAGQVVLGRAEVDRHGRVFAVHRGERFQMGTLPRKGGYRPLQGREGVGLATFLPAGPHLVVAAKADYDAYLAENPNGKVKLAETFILGPEQANG